MVLSKASYYRSFEARSMIVILHIEEPSLLEGVVYLLSFLDD